MTGTKLFVGNLSYSTTEHDLRELLCRSGATVVSVRVVTDLDTGRSKGHAFVEVKTAEEAERAARELNGFEFGGRAIVVNEARPQGTRTAHRPPEGQRK
jgi:RNA recognition motif-containing protein